MQSLVFVGLADVDQNGFLRLDALVGLLAIAVREASLGEHSVYLHPGRVLEGVLEPRPDEAVSRLHFALEFGQLRLHRVVCNEGVVEPAFVLGRLGRCRCLLLHFRSHSHHAPRRPLAIQTWRIDSSAIAAQ